MAISNESQEDLIMSHDDKSIMSRLIPGKKFKLLTFLGEILKEKSVKQDRSKPKHKMVKFGR